MEPCVLRLLSVWTRSGLERSAWQVCMYSSNVVRLVFFCPAFARCRSSSALSSASLRFRCSSSARRRSSSARLRSSSALSSASLRFRCSSSTRLRSPSARLRSRSALTSASLRFAALHLHVFAPVLLARLLLEVAAQDAQYLIPALRTFFGFGFNW
jgi:hypothetical protein